MAEGRNEGIQMSGGTINAGTFAVGRGATARTDVQQSGREDVARRLEELLRQLEAHRNEVPDEVHADTRAVEDELAKERPDKHRVMEVLRGITDSVRSVSGLATAADDLLTAVSAVF